jgi:hypothetical protein
VRSIADPQPNLKLLFRIRNTLMRIFITKYRTRKLELIGTVFKIVQRKKLLQSSQKYRVRILDPEEKLIPDPGVRKAPDPKITLQNQLPQSQNYDKFKE